MKTPAAYLRRSYVDVNSPGDISREAQRATVGRLAAADGHNGNLVEYDDWGVSADVAKSAKRTAYARLLEDMEAGQVSAVYAFDVDRLYRDPRDLIRLQNAAQAHSVKIVTTGGRLAIGDGDDPAAEAFAFIGAVFGRMELQKAKKRNRAAREARIARGDRFGHPLYGFLHVREASGRIVRAPNPAQPLAPILAAFRDAGTVLGAARLLNERGIPSAKGGKWYTSQLTRVLEAHAPELLPRRGSSGARIRASATLSQLIRCHCGHTMTPNTHRRQLYCSRGTIVPDHGRYVVQEAALLPWIREEASRLVTPDKVSLAASNEARRAELTEQRERLGWAVADGLLDRELAASRAAGIDGELAALEVAETIVTIPAIDWSWPAAAVNAVLRAVWDHVELDEQMRPVRATWRVPEWRREVAIP
jgi:DNA invertase Pin-like site-specific DNA recombinase